ncbi:hypothetical protein [Hymenobacter guriensis]|uniref:Uncharacterized protein n=1 Tax=Hymenobacter guriensis TaxID=2793065 RepID=A0ABS0L4M9_9BACT|nr:hypothetical protein [Hymenobacter guriensis]MBG8555113.1 hypothetical protein [Hymenobacter guriensis]
MSHTAHHTAEAVALAAAALKGTDVSYPLFSLHALQMRPSPGVEWVDCPARLFLQERAGAWIVALCGTTSRLFHTSTYDQYSFKLDEQEFVDRFELLAYFQNQRQQILALLDQTGAIKLGQHGELETVTPELGQALSLDQMQRAVSGVIDIHSWAGEHQAHALTDTSLVIHTDGKYTGSPINALATCLWFLVYPLGVYSSGGYGKPDFVVGDVLLVRDTLLR